MGRAKHKNRIIRHRLNDNFWRLVDSLPVILPSGLAVLGVIAMVLLLFGALKNEFIIPLGIIGVTVSSCYVFKNSTYKRPGSERERRITDILIIIGVVIWAAFNLSYASHHMLIDRDPAAYVVSGTWLIENHSLEVRVPQVFGEIEGIQVGASGINLEADKGRFYTHGNNLLPAFLGLFGRVVGLERMTLVNVIFGAAAILAVYAYARMLMLPRWAIVSVAALGISLPMIYFSRDTYTEPLTMMFVFGTFTLVGTAIQTQKKYLWLLAGITAGASLLTRIDSVLVMVCLAAFIIYLLLLSSDKDRSRNVGGALLFVIGAAVAMLIAWVDLVTLSKEYYRLQRSLYLRPILLIISVLATGALIVYFDQKNALSNRIRKFITRKGPFIAVLCVLLSFILLASRPLWYTGYTNNQHLLTARLQAESGFDIEPRNYKEQTLVWLGWYLGPVTVILGMLGLAVAAYFSCRRVSSLAVGMITVLGVSVLYLANHSITPDQIWAIRRFLPVTIPGLLVFGVYVLAVINQRFQVSGLVKGVGSIAIVAIIIYVPFYVSQPFLKTEVKTHYPLVSGFCSGLPEDAAVLWLGTGVFEMMHPSYTYCGVPSAGYVKDTNEINGNLETLAQVSRHVRKAGYTPVLVVYEREANRYRDEVNSNLTKIVTSSWVEYEQTLYGAPENVLTKSETVLGGEILSDGRVISLE